MRRVAALSTLAGTDALAQFNRGAVVRGAVTAAAAVGVGSPRAAKASTSNLFELDMPQFSEGWKLDSSQFSEYSPKRSLLFDTRAGSFLPADPERHIEVALRRSATASGSSTTPRVIFVGEQHTHPQHHAMQLKVIKALRELDDAPLAIGLEMFYRQHQPALDDFVFGDGDFGALRQRTQWRSTWGYDLNQYAKIFAFARRHGIRMVGLNAPYPLVSMVARTGLREVPTELKPFLPQMVLDVPGHFERFAEAIGMPSSEVPPRAAGLTESDGLYRAYEAMTLWDEYMAESIATYITSPAPLAFAAATSVPPATAARQPRGYGKLPPPRSPQSNGRMVVLVGSSHVRGRVGIPDRVTRRTGVSTFSVVPLSVPWAAPSAETPRGAPAIDRPLDASEADWVLYTQGEILEADAEPRRRRGGGGAAAARPAATASLSRRGLVRGQGLARGGPAGPAEYKSYFFV